MDASRKLRQIFPDSNNETELVILGPSTRLRIADKPIQLAQYPLGGGRYIYAAFSPERNQLYVRFEDFPSPGTTPR